MQNFCSRGPKFKLCVKLEKYKQKTSELILLTSNLRAIAAHSKLHERERELSVDPR